MTPPHSFWAFTLAPRGQLTNTRRSDGAPDPDAAFIEVARIKIRHYRNLYLNRPDPIVFFPLVVDTLDGCMTTLSVCYFCSHREVSALANELPQESDKFRFLRASCFAILKGVVGLIVAKESDMRISIPLDLSCRPFVPLPSFLRSRRPAPF